MAENYYLFLGLPIDSFVEGAEVQAKIKSCKSINSITDSIKRQSLVDEITKAVNDGKSWENIYNSAKTSVDDYIRMVLKLLSQKGYITITERDEVFGYNGEARDGLYELSVLKLRFCELNRNVWLRDKKGYIDRLIRASGIQVQSGASGLAETNYSLGPLKKKFSKDVLDSFDNFEKFNKELRNYSFTNVLEYLDYIVQQFSKKGTHLDLLKAHSNAGEDFMKMSSAQWNDLNASFFKDISSNSSDAILPLAKSYNTNFQGRSSKVKDIRKEYEQYRELKKSFDLLCELDGVFKYSRCGERYLLGNEKRQYISSIGNNHNLFEEICHDLQIEIKLPMTEIVDLRAIVGSDGKVRLVWKTSVPADEDTRFEIHRNGKPLTEITKTMIDKGEYYDNPLEGNTYTYCIRIIRRGDQPKNSIEVSVKILPQVGKFSMQGKEEKLQVLYEIKGSAPIEVYRKEGAYPSRHGDGQKISGSQLHSGFADTNLVIDRTYFYAIYINLGNGFEELKRFSHKAIISWPSIKKFDLFPLENKANFSYTLSSDEFETKMVYSSRMKLNSYQEGTEIVQGVQQSGGVRSCAVDNLNYGETYYFSIFAVKNVNQQHYQKLLYTSQPYVPEKLELMPVEEESIEGGIRVKFTGNSNQWPSRMGANGVVVVCVNHNGFPATVMEADSKIRVRANDYAKDYITLKNIHLNPSGSSYICGFFESGNSYKMVFRHEHCTKKEIIWEKGLVAKIKLTFEEAMVRPALSMQVGLGRDKVVISVDAGTKPVKNDKIDLLKFVQGDIKKVLLMHLKQKSPMYLSCLNAQDAQKYNIRLR